MKGKERLKDGAPHQRRPKANSEYAAHITPSVFNKATPALMEREATKTVAETQRDGKATDYQEKASSGKPAITPLSAFTPHKPEKMTSEETAATPVKDGKTPSPRITPNIFSNLKRTPYPKVCRPTDFNAYRHFNKQYAAAPGISMLGGGILAGYTALPTVEEISAGGIVVDTLEGVHYVAIIARHNRAGRIEWCLPKGHPEGKESLAEAATREVEEETGIAGNVTETLGNVDYWFNVDNYRVHKTVHHFLLEKTGGTLTTENDPDQETVDVAWVRIEDLGRHLTFLNEKRIAEIAMHVLETQ